MLQAHASHLTRAPSTHATARAAAVTSSHGASGPADAPQNHPSPVWMSSASLGTWRLTTRSVGIRPPVRIVAYLSLPSSSASWCR